MAAITTSDVAYAPLGGGTATSGPQIAQEVAAPGRVHRQFKLTFPGTNLDYSTGGVPLLKQNFGCPRSILSMKVMGRTPTAADTNPVYEWNGDQNSPKLVALVAGAAVAGTPFRELANAFTFVSNSQVLFVDVEGY